MKLLGAFFNIFIFYYFLALFGSSDNYSQNVAEEAEAGSVQVIEKQGEAFRAPVLNADSCQIAPRRHSLPL